jgi:N-acetylglutamate synthase-like GNAT family acetyltransferase
MKYLLRPAVERDSPAIKDLIHKAGINPTGLDWHRFIVAETIDGKFAGCGQLKPHSDGTLEMASIAVISAERHQGLASLIINRLLSSSPRPLYLTCREPLGSFYRQFGFHIISGEELPIYFRRISRFASFANSMRIINDRLLVMELDDPHEQPGNKGVN